MSYQSSVATGTNTANNQSGTGTNTTTSPPDYANLVAKHDNAKVIASVLNTILPKGEESRRKDGQVILAIVTLSQQGIRFTVEVGRQYQATALLKKSLFAEYMFNPPPEEDAIVFKINLSILMDCLSMFGSNNNSFTAITIIQRSGHPFTILLEENGVQTSCSLKTMSCDNPLLFEIDSSPFNRVLVSSDNLLEAFGELDYSSQTVTIILSETSEHNRDGGSPPMFKLATNGTSGQYTVEYNEDLFEFKDCKQTISHSFPLSLIQPAIRALAVTNKTRMTMNTGGLLHFEHQLLFEEKRCHLVEFYIVAQHPDENEMHLG
ncbi:hypothetical protein SAMD00019534_003230 [Acytostelium subglobosum LB1]|uniref:hypothetical protein n=1 Tax=Acytostelium subglobosum LB1 TaxID=1410327 RepID=UPI0006451421|nr:hypothetical protein SAMD00019534_003230 [Acytostelium subglobosum LB1]GAM17148.1 hypothetical protein SAMD00019534_003230 [Acytostelium subglobosum LB1]|eukprot:XP_012759210.1 hypothetical protein SAMD00019534_003230 [Acytostelium subglobosum LB1]